MAMGLFRTALAVMAGGALCASTVSAAGFTEDFGGMPYYTGKILPTPQDVRYDDAYVPLDNAALLLGEDIREDDPRLNVLKHRVREMGGSLTVVSSLDEAAAHDAVIAVGAVAGLEAERGVPERAEGYKIVPMRREGRDVIVLRGHDAQGLLWAISSLNQLVTQQQGATVVRRAEVYDYPATTAKRGYISSRNWSLNAEDESWYLVNFKLNTVALRRFHHRERPEWPGGRWRVEQPAEVYEAIERTGELLTPLGITWYEGYRQVTRAGPEYQLNVSSDEDFEIILADALRVTDAGGIFSVKFDDQRFPLHPDDQERFGTAREADIYFVRRLFEALREEHPEAGLLFCPPFYWGPSSPHSYDEPREAYLAALAELPEAIQIFWTGPSVKSSRKTPEHVAWITELIGRKPWVWQNTDGSPHIYSYHYHTDPLSSWRDWHYDGFFDDVGAYMLNTGMPSKTASVLTMVDYMWNPEAYDPERSIREAVKKLTGPDSFALLDELNERLSYFDQFGLRRTPGAARNLPEIERELERLEATWERVLSEHEQTVLRWTNMQRYPAQQARFVERLSTDTELQEFAADATEVEEMAAEEVGLTDEDIFLSPVDFLGGQGPRHYAHQAERRLAMWVYGAESATPSMRTRFEIDPFPPEGDYTLIVSGQDNDRGDPARIRITVNDNVIFEGANEFVRHGWSRERFRVPAAALERHNELRIDNIEPGAAIGPPWFMLNYAVLKKGGSVE